MAIHIDDPFVLWKLVYKLYNIFFPSLREKLRRRYEELFKAMLEEKGLIRPPIDGDEIDTVYVYGSLRIDEVKSNYMTTITDVKANAMLRAMIEIMEEHNLIETPYKERGVTVIDVNKALKKVDEKIKQMTGGGSGGNGQPT